MINVQPSEEACRRLLALARRIADGGELQPQDRSDLHVLAVHIEVAGDIAGIDLRPAATITTDRA